MATRAQLFPGAQMSMYAFDSCCPEHEKGPGGEGSLSPLGEDGNGNISEPQAILCLQNSELIQETEQRYSQLQKKFSGKKLLKLIAWRDLKK